VEASRVAQSVKSWASNLIRSPLIMIKASRLYDSLENHNPIVRGKYASSDKWPTSLRRRNKCPIFVSEHTKKSGTYFPYREHVLNLKAHKPQTLLL
jgi:hypothetical protein